jgi:uncharacterized DUF497 family protein
MRRQWVTESARIARSQAPRSSRPKSLSGHRSSRAPCSRQRAATRASWTIRRSRPGGRAEARSPRPRSHQGAGAAGDWISKVPVHTVVTLLRERSVTFRAAPHRPTGTASGASTRSEERHTIVWLWRKTCGSVQSCRGPASSGILRRTSRIKRHGVSLGLAQYAFADPRRVIARDGSHSSTESRYCCFGWVGGGNSDASVHAPRRRHPYLRSGLLAEREARL